MPSQCNMASTVVAFRLAPLSPCSTGRVGIACIPSASAVRRAKWAACSALSVSWHLEADDLAAVEVQDQVKIEPSSLDLRRRNVTSQHQTSPGWRCACAADPTFGAHGHGPFGSIWPCARSTR